MQPQHHIHPARIAIREATPADIPALEAIAALDSQRLPAGPLLLAEIDGYVEAALPVAGGRSIANPFAHTASAVALLEQRARQIREVELPHELRHHRTDLAHLRAA